MESYPGSVDIAFVGIQLGVSSESLFHRTVRNPCSKDVGYPTIDTSSAPKNRDPQLAGFICLIFPMLGAVLGNTMEG